MTNTNLEPPRLRFSVKDHRKIQPGQTALLCRPICPATESPKGQLSYLISTILNHLADKMNQGTECRSIKEMIAAFEEVNSHNGLTNLIVGSMDVNVLYPGLLADETATAIMKSLKIQSLRLKASTGQKQENY